MSDQSADAKSAWLARVRVWQAKLDEAGLGALANGLAEGLKPLAPVAAQLLWFSQPGFALFGQYDSIGALANLLDDLPAQPPHDDG